MEQGNLFDVLAEIREKEQLTFKSVKAAAMKEAFDEFDQAHPEVCQLLAAATRNYLKTTGKRRCGFPLVWEHVRYQVETGEQPYALNNNHRSFAARAVMARYPDLAGVFETRASYADQEAA